MRSRRRAADRTAPLQPHAGARAAAFDTADADKNSKLNLAEFKNALPPEVLPQITDAMAPQIMGIRDSDGDGFVTKAEFLSVPPPPAQ